MPGSGLIAAAVVAGYSITAVNRSVAASAMVFAVVSEMLILQTWQLLNNFFKIIAEFAEI